MSEPMRTRPSRDATAKYRERMRESAEHLAEEQSKRAGIAPRKAIPAPAQQPQLPARNAAQPSRDRGWEQARLAAGLAEPGAGSRKPSQKQKETRMTVSDASRGSKPMSEAHMAADAKAARPLRQAVLTTSRSDGSAYVAPTYIDQFNWIRLLIVAFLTVAMVTGGAYVFLTRTDQGQFLLATWGREADSAAYAQLGRRLMNEGSVPAAVQAFEMALGRDSGNLSVLLDLGGAYEANEQFDRAELAYRRAISLHPDNSAPYQRMISLFQMREQPWEAMQCMQYAYDQTGDAMFSQMLASARPEYPRVSVVGGVYADAITVELTSSNPNAEIRYTLDDSDPYVGDPYSEPIHLPEREESYVLRAVTFVDGRVSNEQRQTYTIRSAAPKMPTSNLKPGTYETVRTLSLKAEKDCVIYYTTDGSPATANSKLFEPGSLITLRKASPTTVRAIAVAPNGKISNEMSIRYVCGGAVKTTVMEKDTFDKLTLYSTTRAQFIKRFETPSSVVPGGSDAQGTYSVLYFPFGYAVFRDAEDPDDSVLAELCVNDDSIKGPRGVAVGMSLSDAMALYRDEGGEDDGEGNRVLYSFISGTAEGNMGLLRRVGEDEYEAHYYTKLSRDYIELAVFAKDGVVTRLEWLRYRQPDS